MEQETLASKVRRLRLEKHWRVEDLAHFSGVKHGTIVEIEKGKTKDPRASTLIDLAEALGVPIGDLVMPSRRQQRAAEMADATLSAQERPLRSPPMFALNSRAA